MRTVCATRFALAALALVAIGCGGPRWQREVRSHAALQHGCPESEVVVLSDDGNAMSRHARLDVCGADRMYAHVNTGPTYEWRDVTDSEADAAPYVAR
jgi:hypothetical protein